MGAERFEINVPEEVLEDLKTRLKNTRVDSTIDEFESNLKPETKYYGQKHNYQKELLLHWQNNYDWRRVEKELNRFNHFKMEIESLY